ncbi:MAG: hypothetical protein LBJ92_02245 [Holosporales bacterium]|jgi:hypothetical protein|nr:hypothetical protein [Holosporales bacterium]
MEALFFNELRHILSKKYEYTIVEDIVIGNQRIITTLEELGFTYILRVNENLRIQVPGQGEDNLKLV